LSFDGGITGEKGENILEKGGEQKQRNVKRETGRTHFLLKRFQLAIFNPR